MKPMWHPIKAELTRRTLLKVGLTTAVVTAMPWPARWSRQAEAAGSPHFLITFQGDGGWDPTQVLDAHDPADMTDGIDVDEPMAVTGLPPSQLATVGGITYCSNPTTRPMADTFFANWANKTAIVNGINTRSTSHDQSKQLVATGYLDPTRADFAVMSAAFNGGELPLPHLMLSGGSFGGPYAGLSGRVGGQLGQALAFNRIPGHMNPNTPQQTVSALGEGYIEQALAMQNTLASGDAGAIAGKLDKYEDSQARGDKLSRLASALPSNTNSAAALATSVGNAFHQGLTASITISNVGGFDTHSSNSVGQNRSWQSLFTFLDPFVRALQNQAGVMSPSLLDETTIVYTSDFARTPQLNGGSGKDHHPFTSQFFVGKGVAPGVYGMTDGNQKGVKINLKTGRPDDTGLVLDVTNMVAGIMTLVGANVKDYMPAGIIPMTGFIA